MLTWSSTQNRRLLVLATATHKSVISQLDLLDQFNDEVPVPPVNTYSEIARILRQASDFADQDIARAVNETREITGHDNVGVGVKWVLNDIDNAKQDEYDPVGCFARNLARDVAKRGPWAD